MNEKQEIMIMVSGPAAVGKTTIARLIRQELIGHGIAATIEDVDTPPLSPPPPSSDALFALVNKPVIIRTVQTQKAVAGPSLRVGGRCKIVAPGPYKGLIGGIYDESRGSDKPPFNKDYKVQLVGTRAGVWWAASDLEAID